MRFAREVSLQHQAHLGNPSRPLVSRQVHRISLALEPALGDANGGTAAETGEGFSDCSVK